MFVMVPYCISNFACPFDGYRTNDPLTNLRVGLHDFPLGIIKAPRFQQNRIGYADFPDIVK